MNALVGIGILAELFYLSLSLSFPLPRLYASIPPWDFAKLTGYRLTSIAFLLGAYSILFGGLAWVMWAGHGKQGRLLQGEVDRFRRLIFGGAVVFALTLLFLYPIYAIDIFLYLVHTRIWIFHGANPLLVPPAQFPQDPWIHLTGEWGTATSGYSPLWEMVAALPGLLAGPERVLLHVLGLKVMAVLAYWADVWLLNRLLGYLWPQDWGRVWRLLFFAWNPLVLLELVGNGHNDGLMLTFLLLSLWLSLRGREIGGHAAMGLSVLVKVTPVFLWPFLWLWGMARRETWRERLRYSLGVALVVGLTGLAFVPFLWPNPQAWQALRESDSAGRSFQALLILAAMALQVPSPFVRVQALARVLFLLAYGATGLWAWRSYRSPSGSPSRGSAFLLVQSWLAVLAALIGLFASNWRPWYATWLIALAALSPSAAWYRSVFALSFTAAAGDLYWSDFRWRFLVRWPRLVLHLLGVLWVFGVPLSVTAYKKNKE